MKNSGEYSRYTSEVYELLMWAQSHNSNHPNSIPDKLLKDLQSQNTNKDKEAAIETIKMIQEVVKMMQELEKIKSVDQALVLANKLRPVQSSRVNILLKEWEKLEQQRNGSPNKKADKLQERIERIKGILTPVYEKAGLIESGPKRHSGEALDLKKARAMHIETKLKYTTLGKEVRDMVQAGDKPSSKGKFFCNIRMVKHLIATANKVSKAQSNVKPRQSLTNNKSQDKKSVRKIKSDLQSIKVKAKNSGIGHIASLIKNRGTKLLSFK